MKHLNSIYDLLFEALETYNWEFINDDDKHVRYKFEDSFGNKFLVEFKNTGFRDLSTEYEVSYFVWDEDKRSYSVSKMVKSNPYNTIHTILGEGGIIYDFIKRKSWAKRIVMHGLSKEVEKDYVSQRTKIYIRFLERNPIPGFKLKYSMNTINLIKL